MYLKTLELQGFKSFPDKTVISFEPGITAIVGANGSGKSNISDAVRWVLGEMSPKSLRSGKMEDVIFNGTAKRKPSSFAEVVLTIDNSDGLMKIDYDEVSVCRRLYRSGESEYRINKEKVRLKDVVDLFLNTGIGREGYSIISQGKISEIISVKGSDRRDIFEEAAGISRFRYRKSEANSKLLQVNENSQRVGDILAEVEARLPSLEKQSEKATKYLELAGEKKSLEIAFWAEKLKSIEKTRLETSALYEEESKKLEKVNDSLAAIEAELDKSYVESQQEALTSSALTDAIAELNSQKAELSKLLSVAENDINHYRESIATLEREGSEALSCESEMEIISLCKAALEEKKTLCQKALDELDASQKSLDELQSVINDLMLEQDVAIAKKEELEEQIQEKELRQMEKKSFSKARNDRIGQLSSQLSEKSNELLSKKQILDQLKKDLKLAEDELEERYLLRDELKDEGDALERELDEADKEKRNADLKLLEVNQRKDTLLRMEKLLEGFSGSVKEVMNAHERKELSGIHGPVSRLISTPEEYITAIETALGAGIQNVVVSDEKAAKEAIAFLKRTRSGRATFLPLSTLRPNVINMSDISHPGFIGNAAELVKCDVAYLPAVKFLLGRTAVCDNIDSAASLAAKKNYSLRIVTLDGQIINAGGSFTGGQQLNKTGILSRTGDIARLEQQSASLKELADKAGSELKALKEKSERLYAKKKKCAEELDLAKQKVYKLENSLEAQKDLLSSMDQTLSALDSEKELLAKQGEDEKELILRLEQENLALNRLFEENDTVLSSLAVKIRSHNTEKEGIISQNTLLASRLATAEGEVRLSEDQLRAAEQKLEEKKERSLRLESDKELLREKIAVRSENISEYVEKSNGLEQEIADARSRLDSCREKIALIEKLSFEKRNRQKELNLEKDRYNDICTGYMIKLDGFEKEKEGFLQKLKEEYDLESNSEEFLSVPEGEASRLGGEVRLIFLRKEIKKLGNVNTDSVEEYRQTKERYDFLKKQYDDIVTSKDELEKLILSLEKTMREMFISSFEQIRQGFKETFTTLFGGGSADIVLTDKDDILNCGIEINVQPPGKLVKNLSLLSGGEQAFVAIALYFAILKVNPTPFCIFDEIESALDEANIYRYADYLKKNCDKTQFVVITHRRGTMEFADVLYGITMQEKGVSDFIRLDAAGLDMFKTE